jgi:polyadenylate-binding protein
VDRFQKKQEREALLSKLYAERKRERTEKFKNMNLYVKNLEEDVDDAKLRELFAPFGETSSVVVMKDKNGASRGFGFVCFSDPEDANKALTEMNGKVIGTKPLYVNRAQRKEDRKSQLEVAFLSGQRVPQPMAMYFPPNMPIQHMMFAHPQQQQQQFRARPNPGYPAPALRGFQQGPYSYPQNQRGRNQPQQPSSRGGYPASSRGGNPKFRGGHSAGPRFSRDQVQSVMQPMMQPSQELSAPMLAAASPEMQKQILGERLYPLVHKEQPELAAKITGMFLEMETSEILTLLDSSSELNNKIQEALAVLNSTSTTN